MLLRTMTRWQSKTIRLSIESLDFFLFSITENYNGILIQENITEVELKKV